MGKSATVEDLVWLQGIIDAASPAPWGARGGLGLHGRIIYSGHHDANYTVCQTTNDWPQTRANEVFIQEARAELPLLVADLLTRLKAEVVLREAAEAYVKARDTARELWEMPHHEYLALHNLAAYEKAAQAQFEARRDVLATVLAILGLELTMEEGA